VDGAAVIDVVCGGGRRHPHRRTMLAAGAVAEDRPANGDRMRWRCPRCGRDAEISLTRWVQLVPQLVARGVRRLDIAALPF
jgi:hypothetical protein